MERSLLWKAVLSLSLPLTVLAGPFGFEKGMSCDELSVIDALNDFSYVVDPISPLPNFDRCVVYCSEGEGVFGLRAFGSTESTNPITNGDFALLRDALTLKYGEPLEASAAEIRRLGWQKGFYYHGKKGRMQEHAPEDVPREIMRLANEADYFAVWTHEEDNKLSADIDRIILRLESTSGGVNGPSSTIILEYRFSNYTKAREGFLEGMGDDL